MRRIALIAAALSIGVSAIAAPAFAADAVVKRGLVLLDANKARVGVIDSVASDGTIGIIVDAKYVRLAADKVSMIDGQPQTKFTKKELKKL